MSDTEIFYALTRAGTEPEAIIGQLNRMGAVVTLSTPPDGAEGLLMTVAISRASALRDECIAIFRQVATSDVVSPG